MRQYMVRRIAQAIPLLLGISIITFLIVHLAPGDPATAFLDPSLSAEEMKAQRKLLGLDDPLHVQYLRWMGRLLRGDLGKSFADGRPVLERILERLPATLELTGLSLLVTYLIAVPIGIISAVRQYSTLDYTTTIFAFVGLSIPNYVFGLGALLIFSVWLGWLPLFGRIPAAGAVTPLIRLKHLVLPVATLSLGATASVTRYMRSSMLEVIRQDYVRTARAKGLSERVVLYRHALRNALLPIITILGLSLPGLVTGAVLTETVFAWPGMGRLAVQSVFNRDYPTILGLNMMVAVLVVVGNLLADMMYAVADPRIRYN